MPEPVEDFWPEEIVDASDPAPVTLLKEQAALLGGKTKNQIEGIVKTSTDGGTAYYSLYLKADALGDYLYKLLYIAHPVIRATPGDYPVTARNSFGGLERSIGGPDEFREWLKAELSSDHVRSAISNLLRYVHESRRASRAS